ncbi:MAG: alpha/beta fold hydrolase [Chloroflexi bacterium]|jgi:pimeloyl-ACP methyl ester carboxylesterase|nr:alpha/beta fold hydrolase [Chloroflexota bacterium]
MPVIQANGIEIGYEIHGSGQPLVLIAGIGYDRWMWRRMIPGLAAHFRVIAFDNRGVGESSRPPGPYSAEMMASDTAGLIEALDLGPAAVMGHSMGGFIAQALVLSRPDLVRALVLSATNFGGPRHVPVTPAALQVLTDLSLDPVERFRRGLAVSCAPGFAEANPDLIEEWVAYRLNNPIHPDHYQAQLAVGLGLLDEEASFEKRLPQVRQPTLILFGAHDQVVPPANAGLLQRQIPNSQVHILPDAGHFFPIEAPGAAVEAVVRFLQRVESSSL